MIHLILSLRNQSNLSNYQGVGTGYVTCNACGRCGVQMVRCFLMERCGFEPYTVALVIASFCWTRHLTLLVPLQLSTNVYQEIVNK